MVSILKCTKCKKAILAPNNMLKSDNLKNKLFPKKTYRLMSNSTPDIIFYLQYHRNSQDNFSPFS